MKKITMTELARLAEVDVSTVSRALADSPRVRPETKAHIRALAEEVGYEVDVRGRSLRSGDTRTLGIVVPIDPAQGQTISDPFYLQMVGAVSHAAARRGYDLLLTIPQDEGRVAEHSLLRSGRADGLIVIGQAGRTDRLNALADKTDRLVVWGGQVEGARYTLVGSDNVGGGRQAAAHLLAGGRQRVLFVGDTDLPEVALRYEGVRMAHAAAGEAHDPELILPLGFGAVEPVRRTGEALARRPDIDAVFAASDVLAIAAIHAAGARGAAVPDDIAVVGYDDIGQAAHTTPPLTTVDQAIEAGGALMVDLLLRKLAGEAAPSQLTPTRLVVRGSAP